MCYERSLARLLRAADKMNRLGLGWKCACLGIRWHRWVTRCHPEW